MKVSSTFVASGMHASARPSDPRETLRGRTNFKLRACCESPTIGRKLASNAARRRVRAGNAIDKGPEATQEGQLGARDCQLGAPNRRQGGQDSQLGGQDGPTWRSEAVPNASRCGPEPVPSAQTAQNQNFIDFSSIFLGFSLLAHDLWTVPSASFFCSAASVRLTKCRRKTHGYRFRLAFGCSSLPARVPRSNPQVASQRFTRCSKVSAPIVCVYVYVCMYVCMHACMYVCTRWGLPDRTCKALAHKELG